jgi:hypothetical protein
LLPFAPRLDDPQLKLLLDKMGVNSTPVYVDVVPDDGANINECFPNVSKKVKTVGGSRIIGWQIYKTDILIEAEFHAVWQSDDNKLFDITPKNIPCSKILFLQFRGHLT